MCEYSTCQVHFLALFEHHVAAGAPSAGWMVVFPSCLCDEERTWLNVNHRHKDFHRLRANLKIAPCLAEQVTVSICFLCALFGHQLPEKILGD